MEINKPTNELDSVLENMRLDQLDEFFNKYGKGVADEKKAFYYYYTGVVKDNGGIGILWRSDRSDGKEDEGP